MKKVLFIAAICAGFSANAQMIDTIGALGIQGDLTTQGYRSVNQGQQALQRVQFQQDFASLVSEVQMTYMGNYKNINKSAVMFNGFRMINWDIKEDNQGGFVVEFYGLDGPNCFVLKQNPMGARKTDINSGADCMANNNNVKVYFN